MDECTTDQGDLSNAAVVIIGCGPVGAMLANLLGMQGIRTLVLERELEIYDLPRAVHFDDEVMRLLQTIGLAEAMAAKVHPVPGTRFVDDSGRLLLDWSRSSDIGPQGWHVSYRFHQPELEAVLRDGLARWSCVTLQVGCDVLTADAGADGVVVEFRDDTNGGLHRVRAQYVVGCDGARSLLRRLIGGGVEDFGFRERWLVVDAILRRPRPDLGEHSVQHCSATRPATYIRGLGNRRRWEITIFPEEDTRDVTHPEKVYELLRRWITPEDACLERAAVYTFHSQVAERWRDGRMLIAGDAAHLTPPFLGQGLCAGMRDAANLAWKLPRILDGRDGDALLDTYQSERAPHVREYIELAVRLGGLINTKAMEGAVSDETIQGGEPVRMTSIKPLLGPGFDDGPLPRGTVLPQPMLADGVRLDERIGFNFAILMQRDFACSLPRWLLDEIQAAGVVPVADGALGLVGWLQQIEANAVLVRPDRYIAGVAQDEAALRRLVAMVATAAGSDSALREGFGTAIGLTRDASLERGHAARLGDRVPR